MTKARALKKRYIACNVRFKEEISPSESELKKALYHEALRFFGEYLLSFVALKWVAYDPKTRIAVLRCARNFYPETRGWLALVNSLNERKARATVVATSGTMKGLEKRLGNKTHV